MTAEALPAPSRTDAVETSYGEARVLTWSAPGPPRADLLLQHGAGGKIDAADLVRLVASLPGAGVTTRLLQQPFAVAGKRIGPRPAALDGALVEVVEGLERLGRVGPLVLGGRSAGARCSVRQAAPLGAVAALALAFPLHPPGRPERSRAEELLGSGVPTLVVQGARDPFGAPIEFPTLPPGTELAVVPHADHGFAVPRARLGAGPDHLEVLVEHVVAWLARVLPHR